MKTVRLIVSLVIIAFSLAACAQTPDPVTLTIDMTEFAFTPNDIEVQVGQEVTLVLVNSGEQDHELMIGRGLHVDGSTPDGYDLDFWHIGGVMPEVSGGGMMLQHEGADHAGSEQPPSDEQGGHDMVPMTSPEEELPLMIYLPAGSDTTTVTFTVTEDMVGNWEMGCFELDGVHYTSGMVGEFTVWP
ncbi:MAG: hypothetical protein EPO32_11850 [Anaerolineae bacterium]|nr:MAG: hypothetical protein EPO32_11850 [Anaerolineae bacterium]